MRLELSTKTLIIATEDLTFVGKKSSLTISVEADSVESKTDLIVHLGFTASTHPKPLPGPSDFVSLDVAEDIGASLGIPGLKIPPVTKEQANLLMTPVEKLADHQQFASIPLAARLSNGIDYVIKLAAA